MALMLKLITKKLDSCSRVHYNSCTFYKFGVIALSKQAIKRVRQAEKRRLANMSKMSEMRTYIKKFLKAYMNKQVEDLKSLYALCVKMLDRNASKGLIHKNKAARLKSRLCQKLKLSTSNS